MSDTPPAPEPQSPDLPAEALHVDPAAAPDASATPSTAEAIDAPATAAVPAVADLSPAACGAKLAELFPALFALDVPPKPLKLRIQADIQQRAPHTFTRKTLGVFFSRYTTGNAYLKALLNAPHRFDLDGQPAGEIAAEHKAAATEELARRRGIAQEKRAAEHEARRAAEKAAFKERQKAEREAQRKTPDRPRMSAAPTGGRDGHSPARGGTDPVQVVDDQARRDRAFLLRAFETSSLTKANFCALKGISEAEMDAQLEQARKERAERPPMPPREHRAPHPPRPGPRPPRAAR